MNSRKIAFTVACVAFSAGVFASEPAPEHVVALVHSKVEQLAVDPVLVEAVRSQNAKKVTLDEIKRLDEQWRATPGTESYMTALMESACGAKLRSDQAEQSYYSEMFLVDNQGANVCMTDKTSDYWQGDESKFTRSFTGGKGQVFIDDVKFDDSTQTYVVQASVPVVDADEAIGVLVVSIDVDKAMGQ